MSAFKTLRNVSNNFESELRQASRELFSAKIGESFEETISNKIQELALYSSKLRLFRAKSLALTPQIKEKSKEDAIKEYGDMVTWKVIEQMSVKTLTQMHAVKALITSPNTALDLGLIERKERIIDSLTEYRNKESQLRHLDTLLREKEEEHAALRVEWDREVAELRELRETRVDSDEVETSGPLYKKLRTIVEKLELMRWLVGRLVIARAGDYDWLTDPHRRLAALELTRTPHSVEMFIQSSL